MRRNLMQASDDVRCRVVQGVLLASIMILDDRNHETIKASLSCLGAREALVLRSLVS